MPSYVSVLMLKRIITARLSHPGVAVGNYLASVASYPLEAFLVFYGARPDVRRRIEVGANPCAA
jgi:hypothetical protein